MITRTHQQIPLLPVLMATSRTQGQRPGDFAAIGDGELVTLASVCDRDRDRDDPDGGCGCGRAFVGLRNRKGTTTAVVDEMGMTRDEYLQRMRDSAIEAGALGPDEDPTDVDNQADELLRIAAGWPLGTVVECRGDLIQVRAWPPGPRT